MCRTKCAAQHVTMVQSHRALLRELKMTAQLLQLRRQPRWQPREATH